MYGGEQVFITGPEFYPGDIISCVFGDISTNGYYVSTTKCLCIAPDWYYDGIVNLKIKIARGNAILTGATKYRYSEWAAVIVNLYIYTCI